MPAPNPETLLAELEPLSHAARVRAMVEMGRQAQGAEEEAASAAALLQTLASDSRFYPRLMVLYACYGSRDGGAVTRALTDDPSRGIRRLAAGLAPLTLDADALGATLAAATPAPAREALLRAALRRGRGAAAVDAFLEGLATPAEGAENPDAGRLGSLLPYGSPEIVLRHLSSVGERMSGEDWTRMARWHPDIALDALGRRVNAQTESDARLVSHVNAALPVLARDRPDAVLALVGALRRHESLSGLALQPLAERRPDAVADLVLASEGEVNVAFATVAHRLTPNRLLTLLTAQPTVLAHASLWFKRLRPDVRRVVYALAGRGWQNAEGILDGEIVAALPDADLRAGEARRHLALPALATRAERRLPYAAFLPWYEARAMLDPFIRNPDADLRAVALGSLIATARYQTERLGDVLALVRARANEQDPIRLTMLTALRDLPPRRWLPEHLDDLGQIFRAALDAADLSASTASAVEGLVVALVPAHPDWAASWLATLAQERGALYTSLAKRLNDREVRQIAPALLPVLATWQTRERESALVSAASRLGRRLAAFDGLPEILERVVASTRQQHVASQLLGLLKTHCPRRMPELIPALVVLDASIVTLPAVYGYLHRHRQDLLSPFLGQTAYAGRFSTGKTRFVLPVEDGFHRWMPTQQARFAQILTEVTEDTARDTPTLQQAIRQLAALPAVAPDRLMALAGLSTGVKPAIRDAALRALSRRDAGDGVPTLVEALGDGRARIAIYVLRTVLRDMPAPRALALLEAVPMTRVTVAKEVIRLIGDLQTANAYPVLLRFAATPDLHRDVRVALLRAFWNYPERDETWPLLNAAAIDPDPAIARGVVRLPAERLSTLAQARLRQLLALLLAHPEVRVRMDALDRCVGLPLADPEQILLAPLLALLASPLPDESLAAARAVFATYAERAPAAVGAAFTAILPNRRALLAAVEQLYSSLAWNRSRRDAVVRAVLAALEPDPLTVTLRVRLALAGLPPDDVPPFLASLADTSTLHADALATAITLLETPPRFRRAAPVGPPAVEAALAPNPDERLRRLALAALIGQSRQTEGWTAALRERLERYQTDASPLVASAAAFVFPPPPGLSA